VTTKGDYEDILVKALSERRWEGQVCMWARCGGWLAMHTRTAVLVPTAAGKRYQKTADWRTDAGWPDWAFARDGVLLLAELKQEGGYVEPLQRAWMSELFPIGHHPELGYAWFPRQWREVRRVLAGD
jgi:hypothetical protein